MKYVGLLLGLSMASSFASAREFNFNGGNYGEGGGEKPNYNSEYQKSSFRLLKNGSKIRVVDVANNIVYGFDTENPGEQLLTPKFLEKIRNEPGSRTIGKLIDRITLSDISVDENGAMRGNFNLYIVNNSVFGSLSAKLRIGAHVVSKTCEVQKYSGYDQKTFQPITSKYQGSCVEAEVGTTFGLANLEATNALGGKPFGSEFVNAIGLAIDTILKFYSPVVTGLIKLYEQR